MKFRWKEFGSDLRNVRENSFLGLRAAARKLKIHHATWCRAEQGKPIEAPTLIFLCEWMGNDPIIYSRRRP
jgi:hypothetical protein